ncbi:hypothetical protein GN958_ATG14932 [Phytophthora infestans]|uniref:Uncharacterized protein n=1 Tax=Phytophthora infestans TaxID=4787 RepID=A0A8S9U4U8_PHYIN|nr:hypothetical protein GN958_ATG14932 [Phytophthora infestans]
MGGVSPKRRKQRKERGRPSSRVASWWRHEGDEFAIEQASTSSSTSFDRSATSISGRTDSGVWCGLEMTALNDVRRMAVDVKRRAELTPIGRLEQALVAESDTTLDPKMMFQTGGATVRMVADDWCEMERGRTAGELGGVERTEVDGLVEAEWVTDEVLV